MDLRDRILAAAAELYGTNGFRGATTRRIAERAGVNEITLFRHFGSKTRLLHEAIKCAGLSSDTAALPRDPVDPREELTAWALANHRELHNRRSLIRTAMGDMEERPELVPSDRSPAVCAGHVLRAYLTRLAETGKLSPGVDPRIASAMFMGTLFADAIGRDVLSELYPESPESSIRQYVDLFIRALGVEEKPS